ncbi:ABC transporter ATP-binding protein [Acidocella aminolytica]|jgi:putative spermidine/putrescine transport system ATP-binding protein|uniref:ABC transporter n=1 Tax=Acidocella aminolytica 101 = DSM 11237 TaxID=1120923 RepID=A0A0D6PEJ0_9PROT|nr:ABC transporter ATP-binding protein [Acidocella aminolytica]GAN79766.1 ABC transporter [Acidocella aminolytica 101 = DSM 11237]GBQ40428.1 sugar ABC transporter ATP-binding protein [Acidocella aminolytica 101 = DSM 11237]SHF54001.1 carbohydrate ABC transporter ATP-binding protein, CUT1 family (TC 3.A.1.1.-) [Acidocella aminolytica 101 = DSM 11237]
MTISAKNFRELRLERMRRDFGTHNALKDISLTIKRGEFIALLGPSGCGKSTALNCLAGLLPLTGGSIWVDETRIDHLKPEDRGFGMVFQNYALFPHMSLRKNIGFGLRMQNKPKDVIDAKVEEALSLVRLSTQGSKLPGQISGGQQQRVAIARAIVVEPPLVLMDEPLSNLDAKLRLEMRAEIRRIHNMIGCSTIYVTHDQDEALSLADRIVVLRDGEVRQVGTPQELYARPAHADVAEFMGYRNILKAEAESEVNGMLNMRLGAARLSGSAVEAMSGRDVVAALRPEDLTPSKDGPITASVISAEYRGRDFYGLARTEDGMELWFRSEIAVRPGEDLRLGAPADRVLVYPTRAA